MSNKLIHLYSQNTSMILENTGGVPAVLYWGERIPDSTDIAPLVSTFKNILSCATVDARTELSLSPELAGGLFTAPGLEGSRDGENWSPVFKLEHIEATAHSATIYCQDPLAQLALTIELELDDKTNVLRTRQTLINNGTADYQLQKLAHTLPLPFKVSELMTFDGRWSREFQTRRHQLNHCSFTQENHRGRTSHESQPSIIAGTKDFGEAHGEVYGFHLGWSGNHRIHAEVTFEGRRFIQVNELLMPGEITLQPGQSYTTPNLFASYSANGLTGMSRSFHNYLRSHVIRFPESDKVRPVHLNTWEGIYFDHDPEYIIEMVKSAAAIGVERFIIDDGWFNGRNGDKAGLGDWFVDTSKYPNGLTPVIDAVEQSGMEFGLWFEPEMVNANSDLYRNHPEWMLHSEGYPQVTVRNQYVLNLQIPEVLSYLVERLDTLLSEYNIRYIKWDMNRELVQASHQGKPAYHGQVEAYYRLVDEVRKRHPQVEIETCSGGGGRVDFEVLSRTHRFWASDNNDALERQTIQKGASYFYPLEITGAHIGTAHCHTTSRRQSAGFRGITALFGHMGVELDPVRTPEQEKQVFAEDIALYKSLRHLLHTGDHFRLDVVDSNTNAWGVTSADKSEAIMMYAQLAVADYSMAAPLQIPYLDDDKNYRIKLLKNSSADIYMKILPGWMTEEAVVSGLLLKKAGLVMPVLQPESAVLIKIEAV